VHIGGGKFDNLINNLKKLNSEIIKNKFTSDIIIENEFTKNTKCQFINDIKKINNENIQHVKFCIDTCHLFCSYMGKSLKKLFAEIEKKIGFENIVCVHLNDCKREFFDEHAEIFRGVIPKEELIYVYQLCVKKNIPMILENKGELISVYDQIKSLQ
jgi:endonuclease IV